MAFNTYFLHPTLGGCADAAQVNGVHADVQAPDQRDGRGHRPPAGPDPGRDRRAGLLGVHRPATAGCPPGRPPSSTRSTRSRRSRTPSSTSRAATRTPTPSAYTAKALNAIGVNKIQGFFTNDTHNQWTINEIRWATKVAKRTHGAHFIVNTAYNGRGPEAQPPPHHPGRRGSVQPARPRARPDVQHRHRLPVRGRVHVDAPARKHERLRRWPSRWRVLARVRHRAGRARQPAARARASPAGPTESGADASAARARSAPQRGRQDLGGDRRRRPGERASTRPVPSPPGGRDRPSSAPTSWASRGPVSSASGMTSAAPARSM